MLHNQDLIISRRALVILIVRNFLTIYSDHNPNHIDIKIIFSREIDLLFLKLRCDNLTPNLACVLSPIGGDKTKSMKKCI